MGLFSKSSKASSSAPPQQQEAPPPYSSTPSATPGQYAPPPPPQTPQNPDTRQLAQGWITQFDPSSGRWFYVHTPNGHTQWEHPADRPLGAAPPPPAQPYGAPYGGYPQQQPYGGYPQQPYGGYPQYAQQPQGMMANQRRGGGMGPMGAAALGLGAGVLGFAAADAIFDDHDGGDMGGGDFGDF